MPCLIPCRFRQLVKLQRLFQSFGDRLFAVNVLARSDGFADRGKALGRRLSIEIDGILRIGEGRIEFGGVGQCQTRARWLSSLAALRPTRSGRGTILFPRR